MPNEFNVNDIMDTPEEPGMDIVEYSDPGTSLGSVLTDYSSTLQVGVEDVEIPRLRLLQPMSNDVSEGRGRPGQFIVTGFEAMEAVTVIPMRAARRRELRDAEFALLCSSKNSEFGVGAPGGVCASCPLSQWDNATHTKPACNFMYAFVFFVVETGTLAMYNFKGTGVAAGKKMNTLIATYGGLGKVGIAFKSMLIKGKRGNYHAVSMDVVPVTPEDLALANNSI